MIKSLIFTVFLNLVFVSLSAQNDPWTAYMTPTEAHKQLSNYKGSFDIDVKLWMEEGKPPMTVTAKSENKMILGDRFLEMNQSGDMMGMDYQAISTLGFNTISEEFTYSTITNLGTGTLTLEGPWQDQTRVIELKGQMVNPINKSTISVRQVITFIDLDNFKIENYDSMGKGDERKSIEYKFKRVIK